MTLTLRLRCLDALLQDVLGLFNKLAMEVDRVGRHASFGIVLSEDEFRSLSVVLVHRLAVLLALLGQLVSCSTIAPIVCLT